MVTKWYLSMHLINSHNNKSKNYNYKLACSLKIFTLADKRSFLSIPCFLGIDPTMNAASTSLNATATSAVATTPKKYNLYEKSF